MSFILLSHWHGRFGNRMHQYAYGATYNKLTGSQFVLPSDWEGTKLFKNQFHIVSENDELRHQLNQSHPAHHTRNALIKKVKDIYPNSFLINPEQAPYNYAKYLDPVFFDSVCAYGSDIYNKMSKNFLLEVFEFSDEVKNTEVYKYWSNKQGTYDVAHLRRGDIADVNYNKNNTQGYSVISKNSYFNAFEKFNFDKDKILWISDDDKNLWHLDRPQTDNFGWRYPEGSNYKPGLMFDWLEDFLKIYFARTVFRANSSFSWWACFLSKTAKTYSPVIDKRLIYGVDGLEEINVDFIEGNKPHWMYNLDGIKYIDIPGDD